ncbi:hypothetical protein EXS56_02960 [Candidatus Kaiserbacteria bacterium]|nr:hypothetical protein [Candidatus Kaiserbacteria bacterium]
MERTFAVVRLIQDIDSDYQSCHVLAHIITEKEVAKDPSKWKDVVVRSPIGICGSGAMHGAFQERFREDSFPNASVSEIQSMLSGVCDPRDGWNPTYLDRSSCMHGMGHLLLYVTDADVRKSVALCEVVAPSSDYDFRQTCLDGVFMQLYQPLEPEDEVLIHEIASAAKQTKKFCAQFTGLTYNVCVKESWPAVLGSADTPVGFEALCAQTTNRNAQITCASGLMYPVIENLHYDMPHIESFCKGVVDKGIRDICWARTASKFVWADWRNIPIALNICSAVVPEESKSACWEELESYAVQGMPQRSPQTKTLCGGMPEPWRTTCATRTSTKL